MNGIFFNAPSVFDFGSLMASHQFLICMTQPFDQCLIKHILASHFVEVKFSTFVGLFHQLDSVDNFITF